MKSLYSLIKSKAFTEKPLRTLWYGLSLLFHILLKKGSVISIPFGSKSFKFQYVHGKKHGGGRGLFVYRELIEDLMLYGHQFIQEGSIVIDGGANQGVFTTAFASKVENKGQVVAFEPMPYAVKRIETNLKLNELLNTTVIQKGLSDKEGKATLDLSRGVGSASITNNYGGTEKTEIEITTIDEVVKEMDLKSVDFIKLDIEGAELKALKGAAKTLNRFKPVLCMEISNGSNSGVEIAAHKYLLELGYKAFEFVDGKATEISEISPPIPNVFYQHQQMI